MTATYTFDVFTTLDGYGAHTGDWGGYWGKQGPEFIAHRNSVYAADQRMVVGADTFRLNMMFLNPGPDAPPMDPWATRMRELPTTVVSNTLEGEFDWPDATIARGSAEDVVAQLKETSDVPLRSHGSLRLNRSLLNAGLVDLIEVTIIPVICGRTGDDPIFAGADDFDLELVDSQLFDGRLQVITYRPSKHG